MNNEGNLLVYLTNIDSYLSLFKVRIQQQNCEISKIQHRVFNELHRSFWDPRTLKRLRQLSMFLERTKRFSKQTFLERIPSKVCLINPCDKLIYHRVLPFRILSRLPSSFFLFLIQSTECNYIPHVPKVPWR